MGGEERPKDGSGKRHASKEPIGDASGAVHRLDRRSIAFVFAGLMISMFVGSLDQTIVSTALPTIVGELGGAEHILWVTTAYLLCSTIMMPIYGKMGDIFGRKYLFCGCLAFFVAGSAVCSIADSMAGLIAGRAIQGLGGGGQMILSQAIVADIFPPRERGKCMGIMGAAFGVSAVLGPLVGGWFTDGIGWRWCFIINIPLGVVALCAAARFLPHRKHGRRSLRSIDVPGAVSMAVATACFVLIISLGGNTIEWGSPAVILLAIGFVVSASLFVIVERKAGDPLIPLVFFRNRNFVICTVSGLLIMVGMMGAITYMPTYFQIVDGLSATAAGYMTVPMMAGMMIMSTASGFIASKTGRAKRMPIIGCAVCAATFWILSGITVDTSLVAMGVLLFLLGFGIGIGQQMLVLMVQNEFSVSVVGTATSSNNFFREIGATVGSSLVGSLFSSNLAAGLSEGLASLGSSGGSAAIDPDSITPALVRSLEPDVQAVVQGAYNDALAPVFAVLAPLFLIALVLLLFIKEKELSRTNG